MYLIRLLPEFLWLLLSAAFFALGEYFSKKFALAPSWKMTVLVCVTYLLGSLAWLPAIAQSNQLASSGTVWLLLSMLATLGIGLGIFRERVNTVQVVGMVLAMVALILLNHRS